MASQANDPYQCLLRVNRDWAEQAAGSSNVRNAPLATVGLKEAACRKGPISDICSPIMTLSAFATNVAGTVTPIALAVLRLITSSNLVDCSTGMSATLVPP